ncbi:hypothetical protein GCM10010530_31330 [Kribbella aluminosa]
MGQEPARRVLAGPPLVGQVLMRRLVGLAREKWAQVGRVLVGRARARLVRVGPMLVGWLVALVREERAQVGRLEWVG